MELREINKIIKTLLEINKNGESGKIVIDENASNIIYDAYEFSLDFSKRGHKYSISQDGHGVKFDVFFDSINSLVDYAINNYDIEIEEY